MPRIDVNDFAMYYEEGGTGPPAVFVHGGFASLESALNPPRPYDWSWEHDFARTFRFVWYDRRGCYRSSVPPSGYDLESQAGDTLRRLIALLERDGPETAFDQRPAGIALSLSALWEREEMEARGRLDEWLEDQSVLAAQAQDIPRQERVRRYAIELSNIAAYVHADLRPHAARVEAPTLVLHGSEDRVAPPTWGEELASAIPTAQFRLFEGGRHSLLFRGTISEEARQAAIEFALRYG